MPIAQYPTTAPIDNGWEFLGYVVSVVVFGLWSFCGLPCVTG